MAVTINRTEKGYLVNGKPIHKDSNGNWIAPIELTSIEQSEFYGHLNAL